MGKKGGERSLSGDRGRKNTKSPVGRRGARTDYEDDYEGAVETGNFGDLSKEVSDYLRMLSNSSGNKLSLIKMQVIKCDENIQNYTRMRNCFNRGDIDEADRILANLEESNH